MTAWDQFLSSTVLLFLAPVGIIVANILYTRLVPGKPESTKPTITLSTTAKRLDKPNTVRTAEAIRLPQAS